MQLVLGTRGSALALWQAQHVRQRLEAAGHDVALQTITTQGDRILDVPLAEIGSKGLFTKELDVALLDGRIHLAVHSLKDLPTVLPEGLVLAAVLERASPWDAFVAHPSFKGGLEALPEGAVLATSSLRRQGQLLAWRPDLKIVSVRGNVDTRLRKLDESAWHGMVLAEAGLVRLGLEERIRQRFPQHIMLPAISQGALGVVCAETNTATREVLRDVLHHAPTAAAVTAERALLRWLEGGCQVPIGAYARIEDERLVLDGVVAAVDGRQQVRGQKHGPVEQATAVGRALAEQLLQDGAEAVLRAIRSAS